jgi:hypothetical protein
MPVDVLPMVPRKMFCSDFPQFAFHSVDDEQELWSEITSLISSEDFASAVLLLETAPAYNWLINTVKEKQRSVRFGEITAELHNALADDPGPYRRLVKDLLSNLLSYVQECRNSRVSITRPNHSQIIAIRE